MNGGMPRRQQSGFTIVEVLIVLAVTSALFLSAVFLINGKQNATSYSQAIRNIQNELQQAVNDVGSGYLPDNGAVTCDKGGPAGGVKLTSTTAEQGTNQNCIFLGKVLQFGVLPTASPELYNVYTMVGLKDVAVGSAPDLATAKARVVAKGTAATDLLVPDAYDSKKLLYGLTVSKMYYNNNQSNKIGAVGFAASQNSLGNADGSQQVNVVAITGTDLQETKAEGVEKINTNLDTAVVNPVDGVQICFNSGGTKQSGLITIGGDGRQGGSVSLKVFEGPDCT